MGIETRILAEPVINHLRGYRFQTSKNIKVGGGEFKINPFDGKTQKMKKNLTENKIREVRVGSSLQRW